MIALDPNIRIRQKKGKKPILLSICIPTYNRSKYLKELLDVIHKQSIDFAEEVEVVISDNASTDDTSSVIDIYKTKFLNFVVNRWEKNTGTRFNVCNIPIFASGKHVWFFFDDDIPEDNILHEVFEFTKTNNTLALVSLNWINTNQRNAVYQEFENRIYPSAEDIFMKCGEYMALGSALIVMRSLYLANLKDDDDQLWFPHFIVSMRGAVSTHCGYFGKPVLKRRLVDKPKWHSELAYIWLIDYPRSVLSLVLYGYSVHRLQVCLETAWQETFLGRVIFFKRWPELKKVGVTFFELWEVNSFRTGFYSQILPLLLVPSFVHRNGTRLVRFIRHPRLTGAKVWDRIRKAI